MSTLLKYLVSYYIYELKWTVFILSDNKKNSEYFSNEVISIISAIDSKFKYSKFIKCKYSYELTRGLDLDKCIIIYDTYRAPNIDIINSFSSMKNYIINIIARQTYNMDIKLDDYINDYLNNDCIINILNSTMNTFGIPNSYLELNVNIKYNVIKRINYIDTILKS